METYLRDLMLAMTKEQVWSSALVHNHLRSFQSHVTSLRTPKGSLSVYRAARWMNLSFAPVSPGFPFALMQMIGREKPDLLHFHLPNASAFWALVLPQARRIPWVVHWQSDVPDTMFSSRRWLKPFAPLFRTLERALLRRAARIIATSPPYFHSSTTLSTFRQKSVVISLGIPPPNHRQTPPTDDPQASTSEQPLKVLAVGRLSYYKGFSVLLEAISQVQGVELQLVGEGELKNELQTLAAELSVDPRVTFCGSLSEEELEAAWTWCDCLCLPSIERTEAFGVVLLEAMSRGKACIVTSVEGSGMGWLIEDGVTGLKVAPSDAEALARCLDAANADRTFLEHMGRAGQAKFSNELDIAISARQIRRVYDEIIEHA